MNYLALFFKFGILAIICLVLSPLSLMLPIPFWKWVIAVALLILSIMLFILCGFMGLMHALGSPED